MNFDKHALKKHKTSIFIDFIITKNIIISPNNRPFCSTKNAIVKLVNIAQYTYLAAILDLGSL